MIEKKLELTKEQEDIIKEVGTVGAGYATTALGKMTGKEVKMKVTGAAITSMEEISDMIKTMEDTIFSAYTPILGIISGSMMIITPRTSGYMLIDMIEGKPLGTTKYLDRMGESALEETQNIIGNAYLTALNDFMGITLIPSIPRVASIYRGDIHALVLSALRTSAAAAAAGGEGSVLTINTEFTVEKVNGMFILVVSLESVEPMVKAIKERIGGGALKK
jgi:chemotaxis protein CheC